MGNNNRNPISESRKVFCYYSSFAQDRQSIGRFLPEDIDPHLCTHVIFAFVNMVGGRGLKPANWNDLTVAGRKGELVSVGIYNHCGSPPGVNDG